MTMPSRDDMERFLAASRSVFHRGQMSREWESFFEASVELGFLEPAVAEYAALLDDPWWFQPTYLLDDDGGSASTVSSILEWIAVKEVMGS